jgi:thymidylate synthase
MGNIVKGTLKSAVAVCTLWTPAKVLVKKLDRKAFQFAANLYSAGGINELLRTILANPSIRFLVVTGADLSNSGEVLQAFFRKGVKKQKVAGTNVYIEKEIPLRAVALVRKSVEIVDMRKKAIAEVREKIVMLHATKTKPFGTPRTFPESHKAVDALSSEKSGFLVSEQTVADAWLEILDAVLKYGTDKKSEHGAQRELLNVMSTIKKKGSAPAWLSSTTEEAERYARLFFSSEKHKDIAYSYGERLFGRTRELENKSQVAAVVEKLRKKPHSRRAVATVWKLQDLNSENPPCLTHIYWNVQDGMLYQTAHFRSHEAYIAWLMNLYALCALQMQMAITLKLKPGPMTCISHSLHLYRRDIKKAAAAVKKQRKVKYAVAEYDPRGVFVLKAAGKKIIVTHLTLDGQKTGYRFEGSDVEKLLAEIHHASLISQPDHAAYLGSELQKAKDAITFNRKYVQDATLR